MISKLIPIYTEGYLDPFFFNPVRGAGKKCEAMAHKRAPQRATKIDMLYILNIAKGTTDPRVEFILPK